MIVRYFASEWCMTSLFQKGKIYERWSFSFSSAVGSCTTNPPSSPFGFDNVGWKILPGGCRFSGGEMIGKFRKMASHFCTGPAVTLFLNLQGSATPFEPTARVSLSAHWSTQIVRLELQNVHRKFFHPIHPIS